MNVLQNLNDLRHDDNLFDYFLKDIRNFNQFLFMSDNFDRGLLVSIDNLKHFLDVVYVSNDFFELFHNYCLFNHFFDFFNSFVLILDLDDFLVFSHDFLNLFYNDRDFDNFFDDAFIIFVDVD